jgi:hypothetical protein
LKTNLIFFFIYSCFNCVNAQGIFYPLSNEALYHHIDRFDILYGGNNVLQTSTKGYTNKDILKYAIWLDSSKFLFSKADKVLLETIFDDENRLLSQSEPNRKRSSVEMIDSVSKYKNIKKLISKHFYKTPANLFEIQTQYFELKVNPILNVKMAFEKDDDQPIFYNQRGIELRGSIDDKLYFYSNILESQARFPNYVNNWIGKYITIPGNGLYQPYRSLLFNINQGFDFLNAQGLIGFNINKHINIQYGTGQNFIGDGVRTLILSDFSNNYIHLKINTKIGKFQYQNIFAELHTASGNKPNNGLVLKKYMALHQLSFNASANLKFGVFESTIMRHNDHFELQYLNPVIFSSSVKQAFGSSNNVLIGANFKWNVAKRLSFYGQILLDSFGKNKGSWGNQQGGQIGVKYMNCFNVEHLDMQLEFNKVRPFTYSHYDESNNYTHAFQNLAHPLGANFKEVLFKIRYQPLSKLVVDGRMMYANVGENSKTVNWGNEPVLPNTNRKKEDGYVTTEGVNAKILLLTLDMSYQFYRNMFADIHILARKKDSQDAAQNEHTVYFGGGLRVNFGNVRKDF